MKRPIFLYFVAAWCCFVLFLLWGRIGGPLKIYQMAGDLGLHLRDLVQLGGFAFLVWQIVGLVQLRRFNRWFAVGIFTWQALVMSLNFIVMIFFRPTKDLGGLALTFSSFSFNVLSAWYLSRRSFRAFAVQFVTERDREKNFEAISKISQKKIRDDIKS